ncbi:MAG: hypothetical protein IPG05_09730 [Gemmatimonadetes bacterium]|nr:hypothetical protein [Gemmatimonadota bacterium]
MNRSTTLLDAADLTVSRFDHPPHEVHDDPDREEGGHYGIAFVQEGCFGIGTAWLHPGAVLLTQPGVAVACRHDSSYPTDVCIAVRYNEAAAAPFAHAWAGRGGSRGDDRRLGWRWCSVAWRLRLTRRMISRSNGGRSVR